MLNRALHKSKRRYADNAFSLDIVWMQANLPRGIKKTLQKVHITTTSNGKFTQGNLMDNRDFSEFNHDIFDQVDYS